MLKAHSLIDKVYNWNNLWSAWRKVRANKGAHGLDRVTVRAFEKDVETHLKELQRKLMDDRFEPQMVRRVYIPKASNPKQKRPLGIPVVIDLACQQAIYQVERHTGSLKSNESAAPIKRLFVRSPRDIHRHCRTKKQI